MTHRRDCFTGGCVVPASGVDRQTKHSMPPYHSSTHPAPAQSCAKLRTYTAAQVIFRHPHSGVGEAPPLTASNRPTTPTNSQANRRQASTAILRGQFQLTPVRRFRGRNADDPGVHQPEYKGSSPGRTTSCPAALGERKVSDLVPHSTNRTVLTEPAL